MQSVFKEITTQGKIKVSISDDIDNINNNEKILVVGSIHHVKYEFHNNTDLITNYFNIIKNKKSEILPVIDKLQINKNHWFPIYGFSTINNNIEKTESLKINQNHLIQKKITSLKTGAKVIFNDIDQIVSSPEISNYKKIDCIIFNVINSTININSFERFLKSYPNKSQSNYKSMLCIYDRIKYG